VERVQKRFPDERGKKFAELFNQNIGGQRTIQEDYRIQGHDLYRAHATKRGVTYALCYEYKYARDAAGEIINKVGVSMGADYLTADQCHGHRVPMFSRDELTDDFAEVKSCPPAGCLTCAGDTPAEVPCGSARFGAGKALRYADYKHPIKKETEAK
jgi:hypothetical protein